MVSYPAWLTLSVFKSESEQKYENKCNISDIHLYLICFHLDDEAQVEARLGPFRDSLILTQDRCTICTKHTTSSEIILDALDRTPR
jgi:hypothetical protein